MRDIDKIQFQTLYQEVQELIIAKLFVLKVLVNLSVPF